MSAIRIRIDYALNCDSFTMNWTPVLVIEMSVHLASTEGD